MTEPDRSFLDVPTLLESSQPRGGFVRGWQALAMFAIVVTVSAWASSRSAAGAHAVNALSALVMLGVVAGMMLLSWATFRRARAEQVRLESAEELIRLRRWPEAAAVLEELLGRPTRSPHARVQGLIFLTGVLARYNRFDDAIRVQQELLDRVVLDPGTAHGLRLSRAMAMLRADHLFDADRAINELRRQVTRAGRAMSEPDESGQSDPPPPQSLSAGLALVEIYRDVKTGHPAEAIELFDASLPAMREQLGHRVADAYVLVARAYDLLGRDDEARAHYEKATLLSPPAELHRRYPETAALAEKCRAALAPAFPSPGTPSFPSSGISGEGQGGGFSSQAEASGKRPEPPPQPSPGVPEEGERAGSPGVAEQGETVGSPGVPEEGERVGSPGVSEEGERVGSPGVAEQVEAVGSPGVAEQGETVGSPGVAGESDQSETVKP